MEGGDGAPGEDGGRCICKSLIVEGRGRIGGGDITMERVGYGGGGVGVGRETLRTTYWRRTGDGMFRGTTQCRPVRTAMNR